MAQSDNEARQSDPSQDARAAADPRGPLQQTVDKAEAGRDGDRQWTLRRIEGVIGSIA